MFWAKKRNNDPKEITLLTAKELLANMVEDYTGLKQKEIADVRRNIISKEVFMKNALDYISKTYGGKSTEEDRGKALKEFEQYIFGYYRLQPLLDEMDVSDIRIMNEKCIRYKRLGKRGTSDIVFESKDEYKRFVEFIASKNQINISNINALQKFTDATSHKDFSLRFTISMPLLNGVDTPYVHIRKFPKDFPSLQELVQAGMLSSEMAAYLVERARMGSIFICGSSGAGKSYLLNALKEEVIDESASCLVVQENDELTTKKHPEMVFMHPLINQGESKIAYTLDEITTDALLMDFDYLIIGEVKGEEALDLLNASFTGHLCMATGHGEGAETVLDKVAVNAQKKNKKLDKTELLQMLSSFRTVVFLKKFRVTEVAEVTGWMEKEQKIAYKNVFRG